MVAFVLGAGVLAGCGGSGPSDSERFALKLKQRAKQKGFDRRQVETFVLASEFCGSAPKSEFGDASIEHLPANPSDQAVARAYSQEWPPHVKHAVFEGCMDGLARVPARPPPSSPVSRALWGRNFIVTSVDGLQGGAEPPIDQPTNIRLGFSAQGEHAIGWNGICNSHGGHVRITATSLEVKRVGSTAVGCGDEREAEDEWLFQFMISEPEWGLAGTRLTLTADDVRIELMGFKDPNSCPIAPGGGRIDLGPGVFMGCEEALGLLSLYAEGRERYLQGWTCQREELADGLDRVRCQNGKARLVAEGFDLEALRVGGP